MVKPYALFGSIAILALSGFAAWVWLGPSEPDIRAPGFTGTRTLQYSFTVSNRSGELVRNATLSTYAPVRETSHQGVATLTASHPYQSRVDDLGNTVLDFPLPQLAPYQSRVITLRATLPVADAPVEEALELPPRFLSPEVMVETDHQALQQLAGSIKSQVADDHQRAQAEAIYRWVANNLQSEEYIADDRGALWAYQQRRGDCTEFMYLYVALARLLGIPARGVSGYVVEGSKVLHPADFHNWAEIYLDGAWQTVDPQRHVFLQKQSDYIAMRIIQPPERSLLGQSHRYRVEGKDLTAIMN